VTTKKSRIPWGVRLMYEAGLKFIRGTW
jgi:hypothetical protein